MWINMKIGIIINEHSGSGTKHKALNKALEGQQGVFSIYSFNKKHPIKNAVKKAWEDSCVTIVAAGGDGTVSGVASAIIEMKLPVKLGVLPLGTLNHFAKDIGMPKNINEGIEIIVRGKTAYIDVAKMNNLYFINNSSLGIYPFMVKARDEIKRRGFRKWWRMAKAAITVIKRQPYISVEFITHKKKFIRKTPFVFIGNNSYTIAAGGFGLRKRLDEGKLTVFLAHTVSRWGLIRLAWHALRGKLIEQQDFDSIGLSHIKITSGHRKLRVAHDGEISKMKTPISYSILPKALHVIIP